MSQAENTIRLNKVTREFNVGLNSIVEFLGKHGITVDANINAKISEDGYALVAKEYGGKLASTEKGTGKSAVIIPVRKKEEKKKEPSGAKELIIHNVPHDIKPPVLPGPKVLGKIDDISVAPAGKEAPPKTKKSEEAKTAPAAVEPEKTAVASAEKPAAETPEKEAKAAEKEVEQKQPEAVAEKPTAVEPAAAPVVATAPPAREAADVKAPLLEGPKVVGRIELADYTPTKKKKKKKKNAERQDQRSKPPREQPQKYEVRVSKDKPEPASLRPAPATSEEASAEKPTLERPAVEHIRTEVERLTGPKVVGKLDLDQFRPGEADGKRHKGGKRKRIRAGAVDLAKEGKTATKQHEQRKKDDKKKKRPTHTVINAVDVDKQIKDTLAKMLEKGTKNKGAAKHRRDKREAINLRRQGEMEQMEHEKQILKLSEFVTANDLSKMMDISVNEVISACMNLGLMVSINQRLDAEAIALIVENFGHQVEFVTADVEGVIDQEEDKPEDLLPRPPIVTVMGHVDHGKTSLLDNIRKTNVIAGEAGGITQHIGAYHVQLDDGRAITFLDTPGHEAFTAMRARGAKITDVVIIIVAANESVMPQTVEAINHTMAAGVPMIFAINKVDIPGANPDRIREQLSAMNYLVEDWGGKYQVQDISAKRGLDVDKLLEKVLLETDMLELKANPNKNARGTIIESLLDKGRGYISRILVQGGTLRVGDVMLSGQHTGRIKAMFNERGKKITEAGPSVPVEILGLNGAPTAGETFNVMNDEREAREIANKREQLKREQGLRTQKHITLDEIGRRLAIGNFKDLNIIVKADVDGSVEALTDALLKLSTEQVQVNVIHKAVGAISESDVHLAVASEAIIMGFQVRPSATTRKLAEQEEIEIRTYAVIYDAIDEIKDAIEGMRAPEFKEEVVCSVEVLKVYHVTKVGTVAGCIVREGKITRNTKVRIVRDGIVVHAGELASLKRFKDDVKEVTSGFECGLNLASYNDVQEGDVIEGYEVVQIKNKA
ncbi:MAG: translation initiation factor IF-2 [Prevotellaceae bacterium]|jgi:translation initiation factor IF-2|nr:translation initiation factor IF-2 [Prevotellaceae bacterium]